MVIANPIYDTVFKKLMEDTKIAKFFIETLTGETIIELKLQPQEYTYNETLIGVMVYRLDFIATIKTEKECYKKVFIEIQKAKNPIDFMRFRNYLAEQYKKEDEIDTDYGTEKQALPILTIYLLGFKLNEITSSVIKVSRQYIDLIENTVIDKKCPFIENLTHDSFIVQLPRIEARIKTKLEALLSVFEQNHFVGDSEVTKEYNHKINNKTIKDMIDVLHYAGTEPKERLEIEKEREALRVYELGYGPIRKKLQTALDKLDKQKEKLKKKEMKLKENESKLKEQDEVLNKKNKELEEAMKLISELKKQII